MKNLFILLTIFTILASCSNADEASLMEEQSYLKSYKLSRDAQGNYSINYEVADDVIVETVKNLEDNVNEFYLTSGEVASDAKSKQQKTLRLEDNILSADFYNETEKIKSFTFEDDAIYASKSEEFSEHLQFYSIEDIGDGSYKVEFKVKEGISVSYDFNEEEDIYEIHLKEGEAQTLEHSVDYVKTADVLRIDFVNYYADASAKSATNKSVAVVKKPRPRSF